MKHLGQFKCFHLEVIWECEELTDAQTGQNVQKKRNKVEKKLVNLTEEETEFCICFV